MVSDGAGPTPYRTTDSVSIPHAHGSLTLTPAMSPSVAAERLSSAQRVRLCSPLPARLLTALDAGLAKRPETVLQVASEPGGPALTSLEFLENLPHLRRLQVTAHRVETFAPLGRLTALEHLWLGETLRGDLSLTPLRHLARLTKLRVDGHGRGLETVKALPALRHLSLRVGTLQRLDFLAGHRVLESLWVSYAALRDLEVLPSLPRLRELSLRRLRGLPLTALATLARLPLHALELHGLTGVRSLDFLGPRSPVGYLHLDGVTLPASFAPLAGWPRLRFLSVVRAKPRDHRLTPLAECPALQELDLGDPYPESEVRALQAGYRGRSLWYRGRMLKGVHRPPTSFWRHVPGAVESDDLAD